MPDWETVKAGLPVGKTEEHKVKRKELWARFNVTNPKSLDLFELDAGIQKVLQCEELFEAKAVIRRAYSYAREVNPEGPRDKLEFCEFRLLLVYLCGLFDVYKVFSELDVTKDNALSLEDLQGAGEKMKILGVDAADVPSFFESLKGSNDLVEFADFADWATRAGMAGPELLEVELANDKALDEDLAIKLKETLNGWSCCVDGLIPMDDIKGLLAKFLPALDEGALQRLLETGMAADGKQISVDSLVNSIVHVA
eukprot:CAMPEP_0171093910 /NCGR_PEP_ID=MMETSP0766_2-20121228/39347_1 /TAXON_ID=439317 /ORGANISM="Gambierdiscus australes, Strain CAWD 149" /LENGTH=253 /DNA_ID=CAMNT_0011552417 /DNA_START=54 /DNA_END=815 /DNA_ORIENTATION=-